MNRDDLEGLERWLEEPMDWTGSGYEYDWERYTYPPPVTRMNWPGPGPDPRPPEPHSAFFPDRTPVQGLFVGRCCPPHKGHLRAIWLARGMCQHGGLDLLMRVGPHDAIAPAVRAGWMDRLLDRVFLLEQEGEAGLSALAEEKKKHGRVHRFLFSLEAEDEALAEALGLQFVRLDGLPGIDTLAVERDPIARFEQLAPQAQAHLRRVVTVVGPKRAGKSELARRLAARYRAALLPDVAPLLHGHDQPATADWLESAARAAVKLRARVLSMAGAVVIEDGCSLGFVLENEREKGRPLTNEGEPLEAMTSHLYLVADVEPRTGEAGDEAGGAGGTLAEWLRDRWLSELGSRGGRHVLLRGAADERLEQACEAVDALLRERLAGGQRADAPPAERGPGGGR